MWHSHAIISDEAKADLLTCNFSGVGPLGAAPNLQNAPEVSFQTLKDVMVELELRLIKGCAVSC